VINVKTPKQLAKNLRAIIKQALALMETKEIIVNLALGGDAG
jgi:hypothetical protein